jgi:asparagine N-glycosylation enzyme membrane subunit Stt3
MLARHNNWFATEESLRFTLLDLAAPLRRRKRTMFFTFLFVVSVALLLGHTRFILLLPEHNPAVTILIAIILGLLIGLPLTYLVDYRDPCFHSPAQVIRKLRIPLVVAIPKRTP